MKERQKASISNAKMNTANNGDRFLTGIVSGHPKLRDGAFIYTSTIVKDCGAIIETLNTDYSVLSWVVEPEAAQ